MGPSRLPGFGTRVDGAMQCPNLTHWGPKEQRKMREHLAQSSCLCSYTSTAVITHSVNLLLNQVHHPFYVLLKGNLLCLCPSVLMGMSS